MKVTLIKKAEGWYNLYQDKIGIGSTYPELQGYKLSKQNCDEIFGIVDVEKLAQDYAKSQCEDLHDELGKTGAEWGWETALDFKNGFNKSIELNKNKQFTLEDVFSVVNHVLSELVKFEGFDQKYLFPEEIYQEVTWKAKQIQQPTEIEVEVEMDAIPADRAPNGWDIFPKLDSEGCLILKRIV